MRTRAKLTQTQVNADVSRILNLHIGRSNAIFCKALFGQVPGVTKGQINVAIKQLRSRRRPISSRPNVGYYIDITEMSGIKSWCENWRNANGISPMTPDSLKWL